MAMRADFSLSETTSTVLTTAAIRDVGELERLAAAWNRLAGPSAAPMQTHEWSLAAARTLHAGARLCVLTVRRGAELAAVAPLVEVIRGGVRWLEILGARTLSEPVALLSDGADSRDALCRTMLAQRSPLLLQRIDGDEWVRAIRTQARGRALVSTHPGGRCLRVEFTGDWQQYLALFSKSRLATQRRKQRQLAKAGPVVSEFHELRPAEVRAALHAVFEVELRSWKGEAGSAVLQKPAMFEFFCELGAHCAADGRLAIRRLRVGDETAAVHVGVVQANRWWELKIGFDEKWSRYSPGVQLTWESIEDGFRRRFRSHEFLGWAADWQEPFANGESALQNILVYPLSPAGMWSLGVDAGGYLLRRTNHAARAPARMLREHLASLKGRWFDWRQRVETGTHVPVSALTDIDERLARHAVHYEATSIPKFERALRILGRTVEGFSFIDLGSGKGRVLMLAAQRKFRRVVGVELSPALHAVALANIAAFGARNRKAAPIECICADASTHELPAGDLVVFLYNPFDATLLANARDRMLANGSGTPRRLAVVYINPVHHSLFERDDSFIRVHRDESLAVYWLREGRGAKPCAA
jgi:CelD/BcsL family acetyltransferase involved in cellulose biosynthesis/SAM-dependent methyltransferase